MNTARTQQLHARPWRSAEAPALRWAQSGLMHLSGAEHGPPTPAPRDWAARIEALLQLAGSEAAACGFPLRLDPRVLTERAALIGWRRGGTRSCNRSCRLLPARDGWIAVNLPREDDLESLPAWIGSEPPDDPWAALAAAAQARDAADLVEVGQCLGIAAAQLPAPLDTGTGCVTLHEMGTPRPRTAPPRVVDLSTLWAGPLCGQLLAQAGAEVVKLESTARPDPVRTAAPEVFDRLHAGKASVTLDFRDACDRARLRALLLQADIVIGSARPRAFEQLGIAPEDLARENPGLIWVAISAYGYRSAWQHRVGFGDDVAAAAGLVLPEPMFVGDAIADPLAGVAAAAGAFRAWRQGGGRLVDASLYQAARHVAAAEALPPARRGTVEWVDGRPQLRLGEATVPILAPQARPWPGAAAAFGADNARVLGTMS